MSIEDIFQSLVEEDVESLSSDEISALLKLDCGEIASLAEANGESPDYVIESIVEAAAQRKELLVSELARIRNYWMEITEVPDGTHFEIVVRCAEFIAKHKSLIGCEISELKNLAQSSDWKDRLIAAWYVRDHGGDEEKAIKAQLENDPFEDDNGIFLVREGAGYQED